MTPITVLSLSRRKVWCSLWVLWVLCPLCCGCHVCLGSQCCRNEPELWGVWGKEAPRPAVLGGRSGSLPGCYLKHPFALSGGQVRSGDFEGCKGGVWGILLFGSEQALAVGGY